MSWIGVDLDGTLAFDIPGGDFHPMKIGEPIPCMVEMIRHWLAQGQEVRIFTARASTKDHHTVSPLSAEHYRRQVVAAIKAWCLKHIGVELEVTCEKDYQMWLLYDDRARQVERNTGRVAGCVECVND